MIAIRKRLSVFGWGDFSWAIDSGSVAAFWRFTNEDKILSVNNLSGVQQEISIDLGEVRPDGMQCLLPAKHEPAFQGKQIILRLEPYEYLWLSLKN
jgi:hypothetical protein